MKNSKQREVVVEASKFYCLDPPLATFTVSVAGGGRAWQGVCVAGGAYVIGGVMAGGMHDKGGVCVARGGACVARGRGACVAG